MKYRIFKTSLYFAGATEKPYSKSTQEGLDKFGDPNWVVEVNNLEDLQDIINESGKSIILTEDEIEIYDDYRE